MTDLDELAVQVGREAQGFVTMPLGYADSLKVIGARAMLAKLRELGLVVGIIYLTP